MKKENDLNKDLYLISGLLYKYRKDLNALSALIILLNKYNIKPELMEDKSLQDFFIKAQCQSIHLKESPYISYVLPDFRDKQEYLKKELCESNLVVDYPSLAFTTYYDISVSMATESSKLYEICSSLESHIPGITERFKKFESTKFPAIHMKYEVECNIPINQADAERSNEQNQV
jgi:hypothetical protein